MDQSNIYLCSSSLDERSSAETFNTTTVETTRRYDK